MQTKFRFYVSVLAGWQAGAVREEIPAKNPPFDPYINDSFRVEKIALIEKPLWSHNTMFVLK